MQSIYFYELNLQRDPRALIRSCLNKKILAVLYLLYFVYRQGSNLESSGHEPSKFINDSNTKICSFPKTLFESALTPLYRRNLIETTMLC
nr:hypothetical protein Q903MT_gene4886 [Picea sitchensis]